MLLLERDINLFADALLKAIQVIPEQLIGDRLSDLLALINIRPVVPETNCVVFFARKLVGRQFTPLKVSNEILPQIGSATGIG